MERIVRQIVSILVVLMLLPLALAVFGPMVIGGLRAVFGEVAETIGTVLGLVALLLFTVGLAVRVGNWLGGSDPRLKRQQHAETRRARLALRRRADEIPPVETTGVVEDDPFIDEIQEG